MTEHALIYYVRVATSTGTQACRHSVIFRASATQSLLDQDDLCECGSKEARSVAQIVSDRRALDANNEADLPVDAVSALWLRVNMPTSA